MTTTTTSWALPAAAARGGERSSGDVKRDTRKLVADVVSQFKQTDDVRQYLRYYGSQGSERFGESTALFAPISPPRPAAQARHDEHVVRTWGRAHAQPLPPRRRGLSGAPKCVVGGGASPRPPRRPLPPQRTTAPHGDAHSIPS